MTTKEIKLKGEWQGEIPDTFKWGIVCIDRDGKVVHLCLYEKEPTETDTTNLILELSEDEDLQMTHLEYKVDYTVSTLNPDQVERLLEDMWSFMERV